MSKLVEKSWFRIAILLFAVTTATCVFSSYLFYLSLNSNCTNLGINGSSSRSIIQEIVVIQIYFSIAVLAASSIFAYIGFNQLPKISRNVPETSDLVTKSSSEIEKELLKDSEVEAQDTLKYLTSIVDSLAVGLLVINRNRKIVQFNLTLLKMFGLQETDVSNKKYEEVFDSEGAEILTSLLNQTWASPYQVFEAPFSLINGGLGYALASGHIRSDVSSKCIGTVILIRDITLSREVDKLKNDFIANVSHELRTPLTSVQGFAKVIRKKFDEVILPQINSQEQKQVRAIKQIQDNIDIIMAESARLIGLINDLLDIAKMEAGKVDWKMKPVSIADIVNQAIANTKCFSALLTSKGIEPLADIEANLPELVADKERLIQVLDHLISNALKFTENGSIICKVRKTSDREITVSIIDQGIGISKAQQSKIFDKFHQIGDVLTDKPKGTGVGLSICKQIVEYHGGQIWVESQAEQGSIFSFTLPIPSLKD